MFGKSQTQEVIEILAEHGDTGHMTAGQLRSHYYHEILGHSYLGDGEGWEQLNEVNWYEVQQEIGFPTPEPRKKFFGLF